MAGRPVHIFEVVRTEQLTPHVVRVVLGGSRQGTGFDTFVPNDYTDAYVKIVFVADDIDIDTLDQPLTLDSFNTLPPQHRPTVRTYTVRNTDMQSRELTIDFVVHGEHGVAGPWAAAATPGQRAFLMGPSGAYAPDPAADWHLLAGDEAALPAISTALEALSDDAVGKVFIEVAGPEDQIELSAPAGVEVRLFWVPSESEKYHSCAPGLKISETLTSGNWSSCSVFFDSLALKSGIIIKTINPSNPKKNPAKNQTFGSRPF